MNIQFQPNTLYYGDCLEIMADFPDSCVNLICLDPPFNSNAKYSTIFRNSGLNIDAQIKAFDDMWLWDPDSEQRVREIKNAVANPASKVIAAFEMIIPQSPMLSYTSYMAQRLFTMHRVLKDTGSIYLHCDPTASHYLKLVMDAVFGEKNFRNEIVWSYRRWPAKQSNFQRIHDVILRYSKTTNVTWNQLYEPLAESTLKSDGGKKIKNVFNKAGRRVRGVKSGEDSPGAPMRDVWNIGVIAPTAKERLGYPTQKPLTLYERIIKASSNPGDIVLDPFAGCGTTIEAALINNRRAVGIDILPFASRLINQYRLRPNGIDPLPVQGVPVDLQTAFTLAAADPFKFQDWGDLAHRRLSGQPQESRG